MWIIPSIYTCCLLYPKQFSLWQRVWVFYISEGSTNNWLSALAITHRSWGLVFCLHKMNVF